MAVLDQREERLLARIAAMMGCSANGGVAAAGTAAPADAKGAFTAAAAAAVAGMQAAQGAGASAAAAAGGGAPGTQPAGMPAATGKHVADKKGFPSLSTHASLAELAEWYYVNPLGSTGQTPQQLEQAGKADGQQWRGGHRYRHQRWAEYEQLLRVIEGCRAELNEDSRRSNSNPHRVADVGAVEAARELDRERVRLGLTVCEYREYKMQRGKGYTKAVAKLEQLQQEEEAAAVPAASQQQQQQEQHEEEQEGEAVATMQQVEQQQAEEQQAGEQQQPRQSRRARRQHG
jgi:hypothetical protein